MCFEKVRKTTSNITTAPLDKKKKKILCIDEKPFKKKHKVNFFAHLMKKLIFFFGLVCPLPHFPTYIKLHDLT